MVHHVAFIEEMSQLEREGAHMEWRETWAGLLVLRLYRLWGVNPEIAHTGAPGAGCVRAVVDELPDSTPAKESLTDILDALRPRQTAEPAALAHLLLAYAACLRQHAKWSLAEDVYHTAGTLGPSAAGRLPRAVAASPMRGCTP